jgi:hypothetical protein
MMWRRECNCVFVRLYRDDLSPYSSSILFALIVEKFPPELPHLWGCVLPVASHTEVPALRPLLKEQCTKIKTRIKERM